MYDTLRARPVDSSQSKNHGSCADQPVIAFEPMIRFGVCPHYISLSFSWPLSTEKVRACTTVYIHILTSKVLKVISQIWLDLIGTSFPLATVIDYFVKRSTDCLSHGVDLLLMSIYSLIFQVSDLRALVGPGLRPWAGPSRPSKARPSQGPVYGPGGSLGP